MFSKLFLRLIHNLALNNLYKTLENEFQTCDNSTQITLETQAKC